MPDIKGEVINNILHLKRSEEIFIKALSAYKINKKNFKEKIIIFIICTLISITINMSPNVVSLVTNSVSTFLNVFLALFGIIFTGYAIFQTLLSNQLVITLFENTTADQNENEISKLQETNENFVGLMMLFIFGIIVNIILNIIMPAIPIEYCLFESIILCNLVSIVLIDILFYFVGIIIWRVVSFIGNIYHLFNAYSVAKLLEALDNNNN